MNTMSPVPETNRLHEFHRRAERSDLMLRIEFKFDNMPVLHGTTDNTGHGGLFANCPDLKTCTGMIGMRGQCRVFLGMDYFEMPCQVKRITEHGLGIHLLDGYDEEFNLIIDHLQQDGLAAMGMSAMDTELSYAAQVGGMVHTPIH